MTAPLPRRGVTPGEVAALLDAVEAQLHRGHLAFLPLPRNPEAIPEYVTTVNGYFSRLGWVLDLRADVHQLVLDAVIAPTAPKGIR